MASTPIVSIDASVLFNPEHDEYRQVLSAVQTAATDVGFMTVYNTGIDGEKVKTLLTVYRRFFLLSDSAKSAVDMAKTRSNRGWGGSRAEQVSQHANPDYKQVFDCGPELDVTDPLTELTYYAPNLWPKEPEEFQDCVTDYYNRACEVALKLLSAVSVSLGESPDYFSKAFDKPMALLRGNYYPVRPASATDKDAGIAEHTDYGCLTLLATDGTPGLEVKLRNGTWEPVCVPPGEFVINFGEMLELCSGGRIVATPHRVLGDNHERLSAPLFFNPRHDVNVAPEGAKNTIMAGDHLSKRYNETYVHKMAAQ